MPAQVSLYSGNAGSFAKARVSFDVFSPDLSAVRWNTLDSFQRLCNFRHVCPRFHRVSNSHLPKPPKKAIRGLAVRENPGWLAIARAFTEPELIELPVKDTTFTEKTAWFAQLRKETLRSGLCPSGWWQQWIHRPAGSPTGVLLEISPVPLGWKNGMAAR